MPPGLYRVDTASGTDTPAPIELLHAPGQVIPGALVSPSRSGLLPPFAAAVSTLYLKAFTPAGTTTGTPALLVGVLLDSADQYAHAPHVRVDVTEFGVSAYAADNSQAIMDAAAAVVARGAHGGGHLYFPPAKPYYACQQKLYLPANVQLVADSPYAAELRLTSAGTVDRFIEFGEDGEISTFTGLSGIAVNANGKAASGVCLWGPQEGAGVVGSRVFGGTVTGVEVKAAGIEGGSNKFEVANSWIWTTSDTGAYGLTVEAGVCTIRNSTFVGINRSGGPPVGSAGIKATDAQIVVKNVNVERFETGYLLVRSSATLLSPQCYFTSYGVRTSADSTNSSLDINQGVFDATVIADVFDEGQGVTLRHAQSYRSGGSSSNDRVFQRGVASIGSHMVWKSEDEVATIGYASPASAEPTQLKTSVLTPTGWKLGAFTDGTDATSGAWSSAWNASHHRIGSYHLWVDSSGRLRIKNGAPASDTDGTVVGAQT